MQFDVKLSSPFHYTVIYMIVFGVLLVVGLAILLWLILPKRVKKPKAVQKKSSLDIATIKKKYILRLDELSKRINKDNLRPGYQELSSLVRNFVFEVTGVKVTKYTLGEINKRKFPALYNLIEEIYSPEFSREGRGDLMNTINKVRQSIESWK